MKPQNHDKLLFFSIFSLITLANSICVPTKSTNSKNPSPISEPVPPPSPPSRPPQVATSPLRKSNFQILTVKKLCDSTDYPDICTSTITPFQNDNTDPISALKMTIKAASEHTKLAVSIASKIITNSETTSQLASIVSDCKDSYSDALDDFKEAMNALSLRDFGTMNNMLSAAITDFSDCDDDFSGLNSQLLEFDVKLSKMASNCLAIVSLIK